MSRYVKVNDSNYKLVVNQGGTITFDTTGLQNDESGTVVITGNLTVLGTTTTIDTTNMTIEDNVILLNKGETGTGVTEGTAGFEIDRGSASNARVFFDESISWTSPTFGSTTGAFILTDEADRLIALRTNVIDSDGGDLILIGSKPGSTGVISVTGTQDYENNVTDDDDIPNRKWTEDFVTTYLDTNPPFKIAEFDSKLEINDSSDTGNTELTLELDGLPAAIWTQALHEVQDIRIVNSRIESLVSNTDLELASPGTGSVTIDDNLKIITAASAPSFSADGVKIYAGDETEGGTGLYFVNTNNTDDELVSRRKALAFSMIF